jgi:hypothetical protein
MGRGCHRASGRRLLGVCEMMHNVYMEKNAAITVRIPTSLKRRLKARARSRHRSLSAQVVADLESIVEGSRRSERAGGKFLGLFEGTRVPTDDDIKEARSILWGQLPARLARHG